MIVLAIVLASITSYLIVAGGVARICLRRWNAKAWAKHKRAYSHINRGSDPCEFTGEWVPAIAFGLAWPMTGPCALFYLGVSRGVHNPKDRMPDQDYIKQLEREVF